MTTVPALSLCLAAILAGSVHAQVCSGGNGGGVDATGNQCNSPNDVAAYTTALGTIPPAPTARVGGARPSLVKAPAPVGPAKMAAPASTTSAVAMPASRMTGVSSRPGAPVKTAKIEGGSDSPCSGGADGGMDATGNQCGEPPAPTGIKLAAKRI